MNLHAIAATIPVPVDARGARARACCTSDAEGNRVYFLLDGRVPSAPVGPAFRKPRQAIDLADLLNGEGASFPVSSDPSPRLTRYPPTAHRSPGTPGSSPVSP
jgi:hypothetical protein